MVGYWGERYYLETVSQTVTQALGRAFSVNPIPESRHHTGLIQARYDDVLSDSLLARPRLQNYAAHGFKYSPYVEDASEKKPGG